MAVQPNPNRHILIADERQDRLTRLSEIVKAGGHRVTGRLTDVHHVSDAVQQLQPDIAIVALGEHREHALELIAQLVDEAPCAVMVWLEHHDPVFIAEAARLGVFAQLTGVDHDELRGTIEIALHRFAELDGLRHAFGRRALVERAKGVLMERFGIDETMAFTRLRADARRRRVPISTIANSVLSGDDLVPEGEG